MPHHRPTARGWPTLPISRHAYGRSILRLAQEQWQRPANGLPPFSVRDEAALASSLAEPYQSAGGRQVYPSVRAKAAALFRNLVKSQHLVDGNKRLAVTAVTAFLRLNGYQATYTNRQLLNYALRVAAYKGNFPLERIQRWIKLHTTLGELDQIEDDRSFNQALYDRTGGEFLRLALTAGPDDDEDAGPP